MFKTQWIVELDRIGIKREEDFSGGENSPWNMMINTGGNILRLGILAGNREYWLPSILGWEYKHYRKLIADLGEGQSTFNIIIMVKNNMQLGLKINEDTFNCELIYNG